MSRLVGSGVIGVERMSLVGRQQKRACEGLVVDGNVGAVVLAGSSCQSAEDGGQEVRVSSLVRKRSNFLVVEKTNNSNRFVLLNGI